LGTYIVRVATTEPVLAGTVERPGGERLPFPGAESLLDIIRNLERDVGDDQPGYGSGSTSSSAIRDT
jgi:hypothetical protein